MIRGGQPFHSAKLQSMLVYLISSTQEIAPSQKGGSARESALANNHLLSIAFQGSGPSREKYFGSSNKSSSGLIALGRCRPCSRVRGQPRDNPPCGIGRRENGDDICQRVCHSQGS